MVSKRILESQLATYFERAFGNLDPTVYSELLAEVEFLTIPAGETLFAQGDAPGDAYVVMSGRLPVALHAGSKEEIINEVGQGATVSEMALLTDDAGSAMETEVRADSTISGEISGWKLLARHLNPFARKRPAPGIVALWLRSAEFGNVATRNETKSLADLYLEPRIGDFGLLEFDALEAIADRGFESSLEPLRIWYERLTAQP